MANHDTPQKESPDAQRKRIEALAQNEEMQQVAAAARPRGPERSPQPGTPDKQRMQRRLATMAETAERDPKIKRRIQEREKATRKRADTKPGRQRTEAQGRQPASRDDRRREPKQPTERELLTAVVQAEAAAEVLAALSRWCWAQRFSDTECPAARIASMGELIASLAVIREKDPETQVFRLSHVSGRWIEMDDGPALVAMLYRDQAIVTDDELMAPSVPGTGQARFATSVEGVHRRWVALPEPRPLHPLALMVDVWQQVGPVPGRWDERQHPILPGSLTDRSSGTRQLVTVTGDIRQLALGFHDAGRFQTEPDQLPLPGIEPVQPSPVPVLPFVAPFDRAGGTSMTQGRGAAHSLRLFVETLLAVPPELRRSTGTPAALTCTLRQLRDALWPRGWQRGRDWPRLMAGLDDLSRLGVEWELPDGQGGIWYTVTVRSRPRDGALLDDVFRFEVLLPPGSHRGPMIDRTHMRLLGLDSAPAFRLYLALCWLWDTHGTFRGRLIGATMREVERDEAGLIRDTHGRHVPERNGTPSHRATHKRAVPTGERIVNPAALEQYPARSPDDLAVMAYAPADLATDGPRRRDQRRYARKALDLVAKVTGCTVMPTKRRDGVAGCVHILPPETHKAAHDAAFEIRRHARQLT